VKPILTSIAYALTCVLLGVAIAGVEQTHSVRQQRIRFTNGEVTLPGLLLTPQPATTHATVIMVHGSGPATRDSFGGLEASFVRAGFSVLVYDKRGVQESTGDWKGASLEDLATDVLAAVDFLKSRGVSKIGLWGGSQGGWIVPLAASRSTNVNFIISVAGAGVTPAAQELFRQEQQWRAAGLSPAHVSQLRSAWKRFYDYASTGKGAAELDREIASLEKTKVLDDRRPQKSSELPGDALVRHLGFGFDPLPFWERVRCPVLAIWGEQDTLVPVRTSAELIEQSLKRGGHTNGTFEIYPGANHGLTLSDKKRQRTDGSWELHWAPGYIETMVEWIMKMNTQASTSPL
jgi:pimeloyl-ACP methyl ester carboxylesterase